MAKITTGLGKGLGALIDTGSLNVGGSSSINDIDLDLIVANTNQPRTHFDPEAMEELATSIREIGVVSPITLRKNEDETYLLIAGERRYRAAKMIGLKSIPAYIRTAADDQVMEMALVENIQREDLNAIEIALSFYRLMEEYNLTQERLSERVGKKRATIANYLRLLRLPAEIQIGIKDKKIDMGHARAILGLNDPVAQLHLYEMILKEAYSVRKVEELVRLHNETDSFDKRPPTAPKEKPAEYQELKSRLTKLFDTRVRLTSDDKGKGRIVIPFKDDDELSRIMGLLDHIDKN
jgi:ParB family chromosome partitioning protein